MDNITKIAELEQERDYWKEQAASKDERIDELELKYMEAGHEIERLAAQCDNLADRLLSATREREQFRMLCGEIWPTVRMDGAFNNLAKVPEIKGMEGGLLMNDDRTPSKKSPAKEYDPVYRPEYYASMTKATCHRCHEETQWEIVHRFVYNHGICHCLKCSKCGREVPDFAFARYQAEGRVVIPV